MATKYKARIDNDIVVEVRESHVADADSVGTWVDAKKADLNKVGWTYSDGKFSETAELPEVEDQGDRIPEAYIGLNFSLEDIDACEKGDKTIEQVKEEMEE